MAATSDLSGVYTDNNTVICYKLDLAHDILNCSGVEYAEVEIPISYLDKLFWIYIGTYTALVLFAGLASGLTLGLLSLDVMSLNILEEAGSASEKKYARRILPLVKRHHLLLVTLLLANAAAVESMPLFLDKISNPITAILVSVTAVLIFGEVLPQALCSRFGLAIGGNLVPLVYLLMFLLFPISYPLAKLLDCLLGSEHATFFRRAELKALVGLHGPDAEQPQTNQEQMLSDDEVLIIKGAMDLRNKVVHDAMIPIESVFMLDVNTVMDSDTIKKICSAAHSRIPIYEDTKDRVVGVMLVKTIVQLMDTEAEPESLKTLVSDQRYCRAPLYCYEDLPMYDLFDLFKESKSHMAFVHPNSVPSVSRPVDDVDWSLVDVTHPPQQIVGIITLEDVIEELLQTEIVDETDVYIDVHKRLKVAQAFSRQLSKKPIISRANSNMSNSTICSVPPSPGLQHNIQSPLPTIQASESVPNLIDIEPCEDNGLVVASNEPESSETSPLIQIS